MSNPVPDSIVFNTGPITGEKLLKWRKRLVLFFCCLIGICFYSAIIEHSAWLGFITVVLVLVWAMEHDLVGKCSPKDLLSILTPTLIIILATTGFITLVSAALGAVIVFSVVIIIFLGMNLYVVLHPDEYPTYSAQQVLDNSTAIQPPRKLERKVLLRFSYFFGPILVLTILFGLALGQDWTLIFINVLLLSLMIFFPLLVVILAPRYLCPVSLIIDIDGETLITATRNGQTKRIRFQAITAISPYVEDRGRIWEPDARWIVERRNGGKTILTTQNAEHLMRTLDDLKIPYSYDRREK